RVQQIKPSVPWRAAERHLRLFQSLRWRRTKVPDEVTGPNVAVDGSAWGRGFACRAECSKTTLPLHMREHLRQCGSGRAVRSEKLRWKRYQTKQGKKGRR